MKQLRVPCLHYQSYYRATRSPEMPPGSLQRSQGQPKETWKVEKCVFSASLLLSSKKDSELYEGGDHDSLTHFCISITWYSVCEYIAGTHEIIVECVDDGWMEG